ncbi:hypothetical protein GCM10007916_09590 [Psychromonas marina]|uniref:ABC transporter permease n=1 Tax=Psychromonas marina TaxID=88364 RepID=A0ABQ6DXR7_9GAMM|nr:ABC transporter permease [Psychromonas marina]GLS89892.1 hypothetical protein GCM10007916_09590 [Psychromonas marina]
MAIFSLAFKSLLNRKFTFLITLFSIAISVALILGVQTLKDETKTSFMKSISGTDLIVGARGASSQLLLSSVFHIGNTTNTIKYDSYKEISQLPVVEWAVPISLGDSHKGYTVMATELSFFDHFSYANKQSLSVQSGEISDDMFAVIIGSDVAKKLNYKVGDNVVMTHGGGEIDGHDHDNIPYFISAILTSSFTAIDQTLIISLEAMEAMHTEHNDFHSALPSEQSTRTDTQQDDGHKHEQHDHDAHNNHDTHNDHAAHNDHDDHDDHDEHAAHNDHDDHNDHDAHDEHAAHNEHNEHNDHDAHNDHNDHDAHNDHAAHNDHNDHDAHHDHHDHADHADHAHQHNDTPEQRIARLLQIKPENINAVFIGLTSRQAVLGVQNYVNNYKNEPLTAIMPAVALQELWAFFAIAEVALDIVTVFVVLVGLLGMLSIILMSLNERRREMAILRSVGARPGHIFALIIGEAAAVCFSGIVMGIALLYGLLFALQAPLANHFGFYLDINFLNLNDLWVLATIQISALIIAIIPGVLIYKTSLSDGMNIKF